MDTFFFGFPKKKIKEKKKEERNGQQTLLK